MPNKPNNKGKSCRFTDEQLEKLALMAIQNEERIEVLEQIANNLVKDAIAAGRFKENASFLLSRVMTQDAIHAVAEKDRDRKRFEKRAFFGLT